MIEMRWLKKGEGKVLQWKPTIDCYVMGVKQDIDWEDVPTVEEDNDKRD